MFLFLLFRQENKVSSQIFDVGNSFHYIVCNTKARANGDFPNPCPDVTLYSLSASIKLNLQSLVLWVLLLLRQPVHLPHLCASQRVHHAGHHPGQEEGHHDPSLPKNHQAGCSCHPPPHLDPLHCSCSSSNYQHYHSCHQQYKVGF